MAGQAYPPRLLSRDFSLKKVLTRRKHPIYSVPTVETTRARARYNTERVIEDMTLRGWNNSELARRARISDMTVTRFLRGESQTAKTAARIAKALGYSVRRYFVGVGVAA